MTSVRQPLFSYATIIVLGALPTLLVTRFYMILPQRLVIQWDALGNVTVIGTRPATVLVIASCAAVAALGAIAIAVWQQRTLLELGMRRAFLALNLAQIVTINLVCAMLVSDALGLQLKIKPMVPPAMAALLFSAGVLFWRIERGAKSAAARTAAIVLVAAATVLLAFSAAAANAVVGYVATALAVLAMVAVALPQNS